MPNYSFTKDAKLDLINIRRFTMSRWGKAQAQKYEKQLQETIQLIARTPLLGKARIDVGDNIFSFPHSNHVIYYILGKSGIVVFGIIHKRMVPSKHLSERIN